jgi:hypothetical protein
MDHFLHSLKPDCAGAAGVLAPVLVDGLQGRQKVAVGLRRDDAQPANAPPSLVLSKRGRGDGFAAILTVFN